MTRTSAAFLRFDTQKHPYLPDNPSVQTAKQIATLHMTVGHQSAPMQTPPAKDRDFFIEPDDDEIDISDLRILRVEVRQFAVGGDDYLVQYFSPLFTA